MDTNPSGFSERIDAKNEITFHLNAFKYKELMGKDVRCLTWADGKFTITEADGSTHTFTRSSDTPISGANAFRPSTTSVDVGTACLTESNTEEFFYRVAEAAYCGGGTFSYKMSFGSGGTARSCARNCMQLWTSSTNDVGKYPKYGFAWGGNGNEQYIANKKAYHCWCQEGRMKPTTMGNSGLPLHPDNGRFNMVWDGTTVSECPPARDWDGRITYNFLKCGAGTIAPLNYYTESCSSPHVPYRCLNCAKGKYKAGDTEPGTEYECKTCPSGWQNYHQGPARVYQFAPVPGVVGGVSVAGRAFHVRRDVDREFVATRHSGGVAMGQIQQRPRRDPFQSLRSDVLEGLAGSVPHYSHAPWVFRSNHPRALSVKTSEACGMQCDSTYGCTSFLYQGGGTGQTNHFCWLFHFDPSTTTCEIFDAVDTSTLPDTVSGLTNLCGGDCSGDEEHSNSNNCPAGRRCFQRDSTAQQALGCNTLSGLSGGHDVCYDPTSVNVGVAAIRTPTGAGCARAGVCCPWRT